MVERSTHLVAAVTAAQMREVYRNVAEDLGISLLQLMGDGNVVEREADRLSMAVHTLFYAHSPPVNGIGDPATQHPRLLLIFLRRALYKMKVERA